MGIFGFGKKENKLDKDVKKVFGKIHDRLAARQITDQAISYRNLKQYDKAISLLKKAINEYHYLPANSILGNTLAKKGEIDAAEIHFKNILSEHINKDDFPLIEIYANLGSLYHNYRKDDKTALKYYELALNAPIPKETGVSEMGYDLMVSNVYLDLCNIHFQLKEIPLAKQYALKRLQTVKDCPLASRVYGCCLFFEMIQKSINIDKDEQDTDLENAIKYLQVAIANNPMDYASIAYCATSLFLLRHMEYYKRNQPLLKSMGSKENEYVEQLKICREQSDDAKTAYEIYYRISLDFANSRSFKSEYHVIEFDPVNFLSFIKQKSTENGIINCPNCGEPDILFALGGKCEECGVSSSKRNKVDSLQFALEIMKEFIQKYDEAIPLKYKHNILTFLNELIRTCLIQNALPPRQELVKLQMFKDIKPLGGPRLGATISVEKNKPPEIVFSTELKEKNPHYIKAFTKSICAITLAIQFVLGIGESE